MQIALAPRNSATFSDRMHLSFNLAEQLEALCAGTAEKMGWAEFAAEIRPADPVHGDFQANGILGYAKQHKKNPRALAQEFVDRLSVEEPGLLSAYGLSLAGPGFINFKLKPPALLQWIQEFRSEKHLQAGAAGACAGKRFVVDYSSPNTAKQMHVGHLRSAVIGEAICRILVFCGATVIRDNHVGDWGTQFGKLIFAYKRWADRAALKNDPIEELERLYKLGNAATPDGSAELDEARLELVKLQSGESENVALWKQFTDISLIAFQEIYDRLGVKFDYSLGESFYNDKLDLVYRELTNLKLAETSEGALVVFHPEHPRFKSQPFLVRKADGASNYASTDLATVLYRAEHFKADGIIIVTDFRQSDHFEQLFLTAKKWFEKTGRKLPELHHVIFGAVTGEDGKALKTRDGGTIKLKELLDEAVDRAYAVVSSRSELPETEKREIARVVGTSSVQYADLSQNRTSNYVFSWEKMLSLEGNTAPYLLYAVARVHSIFRKLGPDVVEDPTQASPFETEAEMALARKLIAFPSTLKTTLEQLRPHFLCTYLFELAGQFSSFYSAEKVLVEDVAVRARRLVLCRQTLITLESSLHLLGLQTVERM